MTNVYEKFEDALIEVVQEMREQMCDLEDPPTYFDFNITVDGRVLDGDLEIKFIFNNSGYSNQTRSGNLHKAFDEFRRRYGWNKQNDPLCLPKVTNNE
jgi:hypothetical protein